MKTKLAVSLVNDPWFNLALEEQLLTTLAEDTVILYLWQNANTVVIGKSQNAWKECRIAQLEADGGRLARRSSGGGAVYHDMGNMCYTFIAPRQIYDLELQLKVIIDAMRELGINAVFTGRNDITVNDGRKFSGNAFKFNSRAGLMHGTLLLNTDSTKMSRYLQVPAAKLKAKGIDSVRSRIVNLTELNPDITPALVSEALKNSFINNYTTFESEQTYSLDYLVKIGDLYDKYSSWNWRLGQTPVFDMTFEKHFTWGNMEVMLSADKGIIASAAVFTDAMNPDIADMIQSALPGKRLCYNDLCATVAGILPDNDEYSAISSDLCAWLTEVF